MIYQEQIRQQAIEMLQMTQMVHQTVHRIITEIAVIAVDQAHLVAKAETIVEAEILHIAVEVIHQAIAQIVEIIQVQMQTLIHKEK
jgi:hypothetical protein